MKVRIQKHPNGQNSAYIIPGRYKAVRVGTVGPCAPSALGRLVVEQARDLGYAIPIKAPEEAP